MSQISTSFNKKINFWGRLTMGIGMIISLGAPILMMFLYDLFPGWEVILLSIAALAAVFVVNWIVEPLTYFPMLGVAGTYQAWLVGNISNKLLPAAITAQGAVGAKPGTRKAEIVAICAISGAVIVHVFTMVVLVGFGGTYIISLLPDQIVRAFDFILPAILGPVIVQLFFTIKNWQLTLSSIVVASLVIFAVIPLIPGLANFGLIISVLAVLTIAISFYSKNKKRSELAAPANKELDKDEIVEKR